MPRKQAAPRSTTRPAARGRKASGVISVRGSLMEPYSLGRLSGGEVGPETAVKVSSIFAVCRFIAQGVAVMPLHVMRTMGNGRKEQADIPAAYTIRKRPNRWQSTFDFLCLQAYWTALHGNGFARIIPGDRGWMTELRPMHPTRVKIERVPDYSVRYQFLDDTGKWVPLKQEEVLHWRWMSDNGLWGMAPSEVCSTSIALARQLDVAATAFWKNGARPDHAIVTDEKLDQAAIDRLRAEFRDLYGGNNRGAPVVLNRKMQIQPLAGNTMEQSQYQELRASILPDIARCWGVPSTLLGDSKMARWSNVEQEHLAAQVWCLLPWQRRMESPFDMALQPVYGEDVYVKLDNRGLLRGDTAARVQLYQALFNMGAISPNTVRDLEDFQLLDDPAADQTYMQLGFSTLAAAAAQAATPAAEAAAPATDTAPADQPAEESPAEDLLDDEGESVDAAGGFTIGQRVYWDGGDGVIEHLMTSGVLGVEGSPFAIQATPEEPAASVRVYLNGEPTEFTVGKRVSELSAQPLTGESQ